MQFLEMLQAASQGIIPFLMAVGLFLYRRHGRAVVQQAADYAETRFGIEIEQSAIASVERSIYNIAQEAFEDGHTDFYEIARLALAEIQITKPDSLAIAKPTETGAARIVKNAVRDRLQTHIAAAVK